ncbi:MAG: polysaccharide biosynthesis/export family protein [Bacteroidota bacterium]
MRKYSAILLLLGVFFLSESCSYKNRNILFKTPKKIKSKQPVLVVNGKDSATAQYRHRIKIGDRLILRFLNNYDIGGAAAQSATSNAGASMGADNSYLVNYDSTTTLPLIGRINLIGLTRLEASEKLEKEYSKFIVKPIIDVNIATLSVTILGEITNSGKIFIDKENTTIVDVIAKAGGIKETGKKNNIKIIRGTEIIIVDLKRIEALQSSAIIMQDNDIVYVEPYNVKANSEPYVAAQPIFTFVMATAQLALFITNVYLIYKR